MRDSKQRPHLSILPLFVSCVCIRLVQWISCNLEKYPCVNLTYNFIMLRQRS